MDILSTGPMGNLKNTINCDVCSGVFMDIEKQIDAKSTVEASAEHVDVPKKDILKLDYVDGIRGILTIGILLAHVRTTLVFIPLPKVDLALFTVSTAWMWPSFYAVGMFVAMSGYCLMLPVVRSKDGWFRGGVGDYLKRRARRMLPPYYAVLVIYLLFAAAVPAHPNLWCSRTLGSLLSHGLLVHNLFVNYRYSIDGPCWTVGAEWQLYLLFPFVLLPIWRRFGMTALLLVAALLGFTPVLLKGDVRNFHTWYIFIFSVGMCGASIQYYDRAEEKKWQGCIPWGKIAFSLLGIFVVACCVDLMLHQKLLMEYIPDWKRFLFYEVLSGVACVFLMVFCGMTKKVVPDINARSVVKFLTAPIFTFIGMISYSHYLIHFPVLMTMRWFTRLMKLNPAEVIAFMYFVSIPLSIFCGYLFFLMVEKWFLPSHLKKNKS